MPKGDIIGHETMNDPDADQNHVRRGTPNSRGFDECFIVRGGPSGIPEGKTETRRTVIEFPDFTSPRRTCHDPVCEAVAESRRRIATSTIIPVEGV